MLDQFRQLGYPEIHPVPDGEQRPVWSVMIPTYNCAVWLRKTLEGVLAQDPGPERMQIEIVDDTSTKDDPEAVVRELGQGRVSFYRHPQNIGATANFNACLSRSRGHLVQILHGDDLVLPGFYRRMEDLLDRKPEAGSAFCRLVAIDENDVTIWTSRLMRSSPDIVPDALPSLVEENWTQFAAVVLRRSLVEAVGGFHPSLIHAADWDLWKRAAFHRPVAYEPRTLACYRIFEGNDTSRLIKSGENVADTRRAIELSSRYLTSPEAAAWIRAGRRTYSESARVKAAQFLIRSDLDSFRNQLREACILDPGFYWSRGHMQLRYWEAKKRLKRRLMAIKGGLPTGRRPDAASAPASTTTRP